MAQASTAQEALIAELLGDVGRLHDEIKALDERLPAVIANAEDQLAASVGRLSQVAKNIEAVTEKHKEAIQQWTAAKAEEGLLSIQKSAAQEAAALRKVVEQALQEQADRALAGAAAALRATATAQEDAASKMKGVGKVVISAVIAAGLFGGIIGALLTTWMAK